MYRKALVNTLMAMSLTGKTFFECLGKNFPSDKNYKIVRDGGLSALKNLAQSNTNTIAAQAVRCLANLCLNRKVF